MFVIQKYKYNILRGKFNLRLYLYNLFFFFWKISRKYCFTFDFSYQIVEIFILNFFKNIYVIFYAHVF